MKGRGALVDGAGDAAEFGRVSMCLDFSPRLSQVFFLSLEILLPLFTIVPPSTLHEFHGAGFC
jgi:hypothetical protein